MRGLSRFDTVTFAVPTGGVDFSAPPHRIPDDRLADAVNLWVRNGRLVPRPAVVQTAALKQMDVLKVHSLGRVAFLYGSTGDRRYFGLIDEHGTPVGSEITLSGVRSVTAVSHGTDGAILLLVDGTERRLFSLHTDGTLTEATPTVPTLLIAAHPTVGMRREVSGTLFEAPNLLGERFRCRYTTDGEGLYYWLPDGVRPNPYAPFSVTYGALGDGTLTHHLTKKVDGLWVEDDDQPMMVDELRLVYNEREGCFWFRYARGGTAAPLHATDVTLEASLPNRREAVFGRSCAVWYGARLFLGGGDNVLRWSAAGDALYIPENNYAQVGAADEPITALAKQSDMLCIFKERATYAARPSVGTVTAEELMSGAVADVEAATAFPVSLVHPEIGCSLPQTLCLPQDRLVWMGTNGRVYTLISGGAFSARSIRAVSTPVEAELCGYTAYERRTATAAAHDGCYLLSVGEATYVMDDSGAWHVWELPTTGLLTGARGHALLVSETAVHRFEEGDEDCAVGVRMPFPCRLVTKSHELGAPSSVKRLQKVTLWLTGAAGETVRVEVDGEAATLPLDGRPLEKTPPRVLPLGGLRVRYAGLTLASSGRMTVDRYAFTYRRTEGGIE